jgi:hypothetical protein
MNRFEQMTELRNTGGSWLGTAREFLQCHAFDGDRLIWGSQTEVRGLTVKDIEDMAVQIATAAIIEHEKNKSRKQLTL